MIIKIAGAGSGKTTTMAEEIASHYENSDKLKNIYCIAYTNNAAECITQKLEKKYGIVPGLIHVSTIHSFLYKEVIKPYYSLMYEKQINGITKATISDAKYKETTFLRYEEMGIMHVEAISERAKWIFVKKSTDKRVDRDKRNVIIQSFKKYCEAIFLDEAQDIDNDVYEILRKLDSEGITIYAMGDPKQDLKGHKKLRLLEEDYRCNILYITKCYRCPQKHLKLSNMLVPEFEEQTSCSEVVGVLEYLFESSIDVRELIEKKKFDLTYISMKNGRFDTKRIATENSHELVEIELRNILQSRFPDKSSLIINRVSYRYASKMIEDILSGKTVQAVIGQFVKNVGVRLDPKREYGPLAGALSGLIKVDKSSLIYIPSIEAVKGMEGKNCLFILTTDLAEYLFQKKNADNKTKNKLYVALTRSSDLLTILISNEVEEKYGKENVDRFFRGIID